MVRRAALLALALSASGCSACEGEIDTPATCIGPVQVPPCGAACQSDESCGPELFCGPEGRCTAECSPGVAECPIDFQCADHGRCEPIPFDAAGLVDAPICGTVEVDLSSEVPIVMLLLDQSSSMNEPFPGAVDRWRAMRDALIEPDVGVVATLEHAIEFGATLYTSHDGDAGGLCPVLVDVPPAVDNYQAIADMLYDTAPDDDTPTGEALDAVIASMVARGNPRGVPRYLVLATDGEPDTCADPDTQNGQAIAIAAADNAFAEGIRMFVLGVSSDVGAPHLQDMANAGAGLEVGGVENEPYFTSASAEEIVDAFTTIIGGLRSCTFTIDGTVDLEAADQGDVALNGRSLTYGDEDGWRLLDGETLELLGAACAEFRFTPNVELTATFPCGAVVF